MTQYIDMATGLPTPQPTEIEQAVTDNMDALIGALPPHIRSVIETFGDAQRTILVELVFDLGRKPEARTTTGEVVLSQSEVSQDELDYIVERIGNFGADNRAGIERTLHRISAIRNRADKVVGLTMRIGRSVYGTIAIIRDLVESGKSILIVGRPGVGKTTLLREVARVQADELHKRVIVVDTSNEIAGDGDIPHPAIGRARRMQVKRPEQQHAVMIEAVENHMPQVIVIDEIGTQLEAEAARTIAERGVQLIGTAHGNSLENLMLNPTLSDLIGGIQSVTLGDDEARRRGTQKSVLERKGPPTFDVLVEIRDRDRVAVHLDVSETVDAILRGSFIPCQVRQRNALGEVELYQESEEEYYQEVEARGGGRSVSLRGLRNARTRDQLEDNYGFGENRQGRGGSNGRSGFANGGGDFGGFGGRGGRYDRAGDRNRGKSARRTIDEADSRASLSNPRSFSPLANESFTQVAPPPAPAPAPVAKPIRAAQQIFQRSNGESQSLAPESLSGRLTNSSRTYEGIQYASGFGTSDAPPEASSQPQQTVTIRLDPTATTANTGVVTVPTDDAAPTPPVYRIDMTNGGGAALGGGKRGGKRSQHPATRDLNHPRERDRFRVRCRQQPDFAGAPGSTAVSAQQRGQERR